MDVTFAMNGVPKTDENETQLQDLKKKNKQKNRHKMKYTVSNRRWKRDKKGGHQVRVNESTFLSHLHNELAVNTRFHKKLTLSEGVRVFF